MSKQDSFNWIDFFNLGNSYMKEKSPEKQRTGISRFYYSAFCSSRDLINEKQTYLGSKSKEIMTSKNSDVHNETSKIFKKHENYKEDRKGRLISRNLNKLRKMRNEADYDKVTSKPLQKMLKNSKSRSKYILDLLSEFN